MEHLQKLGFKNYKSYLSSRLWRKIREKVLIRDNYECRLCFYDAVLVHHTNYRLDTLKGERLKSLMSLCHKCHYHIEYTNYTKNSQKDKNKEFIKKVRYQNPKSLTIELQNKIGGQIINGQLIVKKLVIEITWSHAIVYNEVTKHTINIFFGRRPVSEIIKKLDPFLNCGLKQRLKH